MFGRLNSAVNQVHCGRPRPGEHLKRLRAQHKHHGRPGPCPDRAQPWRQHGTPGRQYAHALPRAQVQAGAARKQCEQLLPGAARPRSRTSARRGGRRRACWVAARRRQAPPAAAFLQVRLAARLQHRDLDGTLRALEGCGTPCRPVEHTHAGATSPAHARVYNGRMCQ